MPAREDDKRFPVECATCGSVYAARKLPDGRLQPIGAGACQCGSTEFVVIDHPPDAAFLDTTTDGDA